MQFPSPAPGKLDKHNFLMKSKKEEKGYVGHGKNPKNERGYLTSVTFKKL
jgi:hypothetical protein